METVKDKIELEKYPQYKDSGVQWLREIPKHWDISKGKWLFIKQERPARKEDGIVTCFRDGEVTLRTSRKTEGYTIALKEHGYQGIRKGDLVIHNMDAFAGAIGISDSDGKSTPVYSVCTPRIPNKVNPYYFAYFLKDLAKSGFIESLAKGIRERSTDFRFNDFGLLLLSVPTLPEQTAIASFLDRKTAQIDQAIDIKQKQIELLKERRQILIHKAVTRGLNPNVKMKDSGVEWIGEIPDGWKVKRLKHLIKAKTGYAFPSDQFSNEGIPIIRISDLNEDGIVRHEYSPKMPYKFELYLNEYGIKRNDLLFAMTGGTIGKMAVYTSEVPALLNQRVCLFRVENNFMRRLIYYWMQTKYWKNYIDLKSIGGAQPNISDVTVLNLKIVLSNDLEELSTIVSHMEELCGKIASAISLKEQEIEKLKEYKATLINSAVTGKIKVFENGK